MGAWRWVFDSCGYGIVVISAEGDAHTFTVDDAMVRKYAQQAGTDNFFIHFNVRGGEKATTWSLSKKAPGSRRA